MKTSKLIRRMMILAIFALAAVAAAGAERTDRYIVILKSRSGPAPDLSRLGGTVDFRQDEQVNVTLPFRAARFIVISSGSAATESPNRLARPRRQLADP